MVQYPDRREKVKRHAGHFEEALQSDADYPLALAGLSFVEGQIYRNLDANPSHLQRAEQFAQRALAIDPQLGETHMARGTVSADRYDYPGCSPRSSAPLPSWIREIAMLGLRFHGRWGTNSRRTLPAAEKAARESLRLEPAALP